MPDNCKCRALCSLLSC